MPIGGHLVPTAMTIVVSLATATIVVTAIVTGTIIGSLVFDIAPTVTRNTTIAIGAVEFHHRRTWFSRPRR